MKMAKPSAQDVKAAEELLHVLQLIAAWGGPWPNPAAGENLCELLNNGEIAFDYANTAHLQTLYNNLARLQRTACPARVISGMCHVIMFEKNEILDPESNCIDLHPRFAQLQAQLEQLQAECEMLRGLTPEPPPRPPAGEGLPRYGIRWSGPGTPLSVPMDDGYWTPWHLAEAALIAGDQQPSAPISAANDHDLSHWAASLKSTWPVEPLDPQGAWMIGSIDDHGDGDQTHYPVITVEADQYDAPGDSEKIAKALSALWQQAFAQAGDA